MGNHFYNKPNHHHHHLHLLHQPNTQSSVFLPMLCSRSSFKGVVWDVAGSGPSRDDDDNDPLSPKVGCMGQVKRNNRVVGFPTPNGRHPIAARAGGGKYSKIKRMFSAKSFTPAAVTKPATPAVNSCRVAGRSVLATRIRKISCEKEKVDTVSVVDMDPPLPVTQKVKKDRDGDGDGGDRDQDNLWRRRSGGRMDLKKLELQKFRHRHMQPQPLTV